MIKQSSDHDLEPQPGAALGEYEPNGLPPTDVTNPNNPEWPKLPASQAVNFAADGSLKPVIIKVGQGYFRAWGDPAWDIGRYWTAEAPKSQDDFYGRAAVAFHWNAGQYLAQMVDGGLITEIKGWSGTTARQPADGLDPCTHSYVAPMPTYHLPGGVIQYFIPDGSLPFIKEQPTGWRPSVAEIRELISKPALQVGPPAKGTAATTAHYQALAALLQYLARLLGAAGKEGTAVGLRSIPLSGQAAAVDGAARELRAHAAYAPDPSAKARCKLIAQSLVPLGRYLDGAITWSSYHGEIERTISEVIRWAYAIGIELT